MAAAFFESLEEEEDNLVTCGVCSCEYDANQRKPKFLPCAHTVCVLCLKEIISNGSITCPFCRHVCIKDGAGRLPNNTYALFLLKSRCRINGQTSTGVPRTSSAGSNVVSSKVNWCTVCVTAKKMDCDKSCHSFVKFDKKEADNLAKLLNLDDLLTTIRPETIHLQTALEEHEKIKGQLAQVLKSVNAATEQVNKVRDRNNFLMAEMVSMMRMANVPFSLSCSDSFFYANWPGTMLPRNFYNLEKLFFVLKLYESGDLVGEILFRPSLAFQFPRVIQQIAVFCYKSPKFFENPIEKAVPGVFVSLGMEPIDFASCIHAELGAPERVSAKFENEIGLQATKFLSTGYALASVFQAWKFVFPLKGFREAKHRHCVESVSEAELFGHIVHGWMLKPITRLSHLKKAYRSNYSISLELTYDPVEEITQSMPTTNSL